MPTANENTDGITQLISDITHSKLRCSYEIAQRTESVVENIITHGKWNTAKELMELLSLEGRKLLNAMPQEAVPPNVIRHVLKIIREEYVAKFKNPKVEGEQSLHQLLTAGPDAEILDYSKSIPDLKCSLIDHLAEYKVELETSLDNIASQASEHIHSNEIIMTLGKSNTVERFLKSAAKTRKFQVIVVEGGPQCHGHEMSLNLGKSTIQTTLIPDAAVFAMMARINKVIIGTHTVMANGGLRAASGVHAVALAAKHYSVPVMVLAPMYKLNPVHLCSYEQDAFNICASPAAVLPYSMGKITTKVHIYNPVFDYVPPELVTLFISHQEANSAVFAMTARMNKVIIGTHTVMANGGLRAASGVHAVALAAKHYSVPVMVLAPMYKLNPVHLCSYEQDAFNICASPAAVLPYSMGKITTKVHIYNPVFDYVPPELVTLFISHQGGNAASYVYRLLTELYHPDDYDF